MAKKPTKVATTSGVNIQLLQRIAAAQNSSNFITKDEATPLLNHQPQLIQVDTNNVIDGGNRALAQLTDAGRAMLPKTEAAAPAASNFKLVSGVVLPPSKRGFGRVAGPSKYPFDQMEVGMGFFVPASEDMPSPLKTLGSTVSNANNKYRVDTGKVKEVTRTKRGDDKKAVVINGEKQTETVNLPVYDYPRKYAIRAVKKGESCGNLTAEADGVIISRTK